MFHVSTLLPYTAGNKQQVSGWGLQEVEVCSQLHASTGEVRGQVCMLCYVIMPDYSICGGVDFKLVARMKV